LGIRAAASVRP